MGFLSFLSSLLLITVALGAPPQKPGPNHKKPATQSAGESGGGHPTPMDKDTEVIYGLRDFIIDDPHAKVDTWLGLDVCEWQGIKCGRAPLGFHAVTGIDLSNFEFGGPDLTPGYLLDNLPYLEFLRVRNNEFHATLPQDLSNLASLTEIDVALNLLHGPFPTGVLTAKKLTYVDLAYNQFEGPIPREIFLGNLDVLYLNHNLFTGTIPTELGDCRAINVSLSDNKLEGPIPITFSHLQHIVQVSLGNNQLSGPLPDVQSLTDLKLLDFSQNQLSGSIPASYSHLPSAETLNLTSNHLTGPLPEFSSTNLKFFGAANNELSGTVPESLCASPSIFGIDLRNNNFVGELGPVCMEIYQNKKKWIDVSGNCIQNVKDQKPGCGIPGSLDETNQAQPKGSGTQKTKPY